MNDQDNQKILNGEGLKYLWKKIKEIAGKVYKSGRGITINEDTINVINPVNGVTKEEFSDMSEDDKKGIVVVTDEIVPSPVQLGEIYSTEERVIGTWIDGKPIYRRVFNLSTGICYNTNNDIIDLGFVPDNLILLNGCVTLSDGKMAFTPNIYTSIGVEYNGKISIGSSATVYNNRPITLIVEYTKPTD